MIAASEELYGYAQEAATAIRDAFPAAVVLADHWNRSAPVSELSPSKLYVRPYDGFAAHASASPGVQHRREDSGSLGFQVFVPPATGRASFDAIASIVEPLFTRLRRGTYLFLEPVSLPMGHSEKAHWTGDVRCPFVRQYDVSGLHVPVEPSMLYEDASYAALPAPPAAVRLDPVSGLWVEASWDALDEVADGVLLSRVGTSIQVASGHHAVIDHGLGNAGRIWLGANGAVITVEPSLGAGATVLQEVGALSGPHRLVVRLGEPQVL